MRWALCTSAAILITIPVFSTPIPRILLQRRGLFDDTLAATGYTVSEIAAMVANALTDDPAPCQHVLSFFQQIQEGESGGGTTTIGDRAVAGARKMLGLQSAGTAGLVQMVNDLADGSLSNQSATAMVQALSNSARTIASLKTYKFLVDTQSGLSNLTQGIMQLSSNSTGLASLTDVINQKIQPTLLDLENTIDQFGADFSVQNTSTFPDDIQKILALVSNGTSSVQSLKSMSQNQHTIDSLIDSALNSMDQLSAAANEAASIANQAPDIPPEQFTMTKGAACTASGPTSNDGQSSASSASTSSLS